MYVMDVHLSEEERQALEVVFQNAYSLTEVKLAITRSQAPRRIQMDLGKILKKMNLCTEDITRTLSDRNLPTDLNGDGEAHDGTPAKRRKLSNFNPERREVISLDSNSGSEAESGSDEPTRKNQALLAGAQQSAQTADLCIPVSENNIIKVYNLNWYHESIKAQELLPVRRHLVYAGRIIPGPTNASDERNATDMMLDTSGILSRARADTPPLSSFMSSSSHHARTTTSQRAHLQPQSTADDEAEREMPPLPDYLQTTYSCQRPTLRYGPNEDFMRQLRIIKKARIIDGHEKKRHTYHSVVAAIAAYPYEFKTAMEVSRLPCCGDKIAALWYEWKNTGRIKEVETTLEDPRMKILSIFWDIHGVGEATALKFYNNGWKDLDDIVEHGWGSLSRQQKIGVKFYEDFSAMRIPREEVESIGQIVLDHANQIQDGFQMVICGGYRRGKPDSGDVDVMLSHHDEKATEGLIQPLLASLEKDGYVTHQLQVWTSNSDPDQAALDWEASAKKSRSGFDKLDKGLVVWQDPERPSRQEELGHDPEAPNPNPHRRVDIIITPWKTAGCAVVGWTGGTTFEMDIRRYCRHELDRKLKFDSSGVRSLEDGSWVDLEAGGRDLLEKEKLVFSGLNLDWRDPTERCTD
ncbi:DNA polymerase beta [Diplocarpon rosae]|nr:DNA polymerase beta [Diplocarpon rosae]